MVLLLIIMIGLGVVEKDLLFMHGGAISITAATCNSGADSHNGIHHHAHVTECDALSSCAKPLGLLYETPISFIHNYYLFVPKAPTIDLWQPPKATF